MLGKIPSENAIVNEYRKLHTSGVRPMSEELRKPIKEFNKPKRGGKMQVKFSRSEVVKTPKKVKKPAQNLGHHLQLFRKLLNLELGLILVRMIQFRETLKIQVQLQNPHPPNQFRRYRVHLHLVLPFLISLR